MLLQDGDPCSCATAALCQKLRTRCGEASDDSFPATGRRAIVGPMQKVNNAKMADETRSGGHTMIEISGNFSPRCQAEHTLQHRCVAGASADRGACLAAPVRRRRDRLAEAVRRGRRRGLPVHAFVCRQRAPYADRVLQQGVSVLGEAAVLSQFDEAANAARCRKPATS